MNKMDDKHRYYPYYQRKNSNNDDFNQQYDRHYQNSSSSYDNRFNKQNYMDFSEQSNSKTYSYLPTPSLQPLMSTKTMPQATTLVTAIPHERESWIRSVKKTKINESTEQKTQYLETMLRMPQQQKSSLNSSRFDRIRFANDQMSITTNTTENNNLDQNSFHLISNINSHDEICAIEKLLFDIEPQPTTKDSSNPILLSSPVCIELSLFIILYKYTEVEICSTPLEVADIIIETSQTVKDTFVALPFCFRHPLAGQLGCEGGQLPPPP